MNIPNNSGVSALESFSGTFELFSEMWGFLYYKISVSV